MPIAKSEVRLPVFVRATEKRERPHTINSLCDWSDWDAPEWSKLAGEIMADDPAAAVQHRKLWEFTRTVEALKAFSLLRDDSTGISVAAGNERILFYLARHVGRIVATDIYGRGSFATGEASETFITDQKRYAPYQYPEERLKVLFMDALDLRFPENTFDFAFSLSSIEHFGGLRWSAKSVAEMARVVRPGGLVIVTTECALNGRRRDQVFSAPDIQELCANPELRLVHEIDWSVSERSLSHLTDMKTDDLGRLPHVNLRALGSVFTSICLVFQKVSSAESLTGKSLTPLRRNERGGVTVEELDRLVAELKRTTPKLKRRVMLSVERKIRPQIYKAIEAARLLADRM